MPNILRYLGRKEWTMIAIAVVLIVIQVWFDLTMPEYMGKITTLVTTGSGTMDDIYYNGGMMLGCAFGSLASMIIVGYIAAKVGASYAQTLRSLQFTKVDAFSMAEINKFSTPSLITRSTNDVTQVQVVLTVGLQMIVKAPILAVWAMFKIYGTAIEWTMSIGVAVIVLILLFLIIFVLVLPKFRKMQVLIDNINRTTRENLTGLSVVRAYNAEGYQRDKFEAANTELADTQLFTWRAMAVLMPGVGMIMNASILAIYWIGAGLIDINPDPYQKAELLANMIVFSSYSMQILMAFMMITMLFIMLPRAQVSAKRINEVLNTEPSVKDGSGAGNGGTGKGEVEFRNVGFRYPDAADNVLQDISFSVRQGETIAFIGSTGSGKTTLVNLIPRLYDATEGSVLVDGIDVREYKLSALYDKIGYVSQKAVLFTGTVASNVAFGGTGERRTEHDVRDAVRIAQGTDFVERMDGAYDSQIARGGANVSGGQKQRLSIARAVCKRPDIYIFDDSFSALDYRTDRALRTALKKETQGATTMIVAQRIGTIMDADRIVVLDEGRIVGIGTHRDLLRTCDVYKEIAMSQLSEKELAI
ncbi:MAG: ABC transporter ATP-binding protein/permease [Methanomassiliicoccaceae archaeon]|jgi:ATP-binding cassette subfamily B protein|nr:ABC transporter ATP-binding protein/permease [Methanomassiliicoccaceae archaeon]